MTYTLTLSALAFLIGWAACMLFIVGPLRQSRDAWKAECRRNISALQDLQDKFRKIKELTK